MLADSIILRASSPHRLAPSKSVAPRTWLENFAQDLLELDAHASDAPFRARRLFSAWSHYQRALLDFYWERRGFDDWGRFESSLAAISLAGARASLNQASAENIGAWSGESASASTTLLGALPDVLPIVPEIPFAFPHPERALAWGRSWRAENRTRKLCVIGLRVDNGAGSASALALGAETDLPVISLRLRPGMLMNPPVLSLSPSCAGHLRRQKRAVHFAVVSEGDPLDESSIEPLREWFKENGIAEERVRFVGASFANLGSIAH